MLDLTLSNPTRCGFIYDEEAIRAALSAPEALGYDPSPRGTFEARQAVAGYYEERGSPIPTDRVHLTTGSSEAYAHLFRLLCEPGDQILTPQPSYPLFDFLADMTGVELRRYPLLYDHGWELDFDALKAAVTPRTRAVLTVNPNNPTGSTLSARERERLMRFAIMHDLAIISDEVFADFSWGDEPPFPTLESRGSVLIFGINGVSKISGLPQMKLGWITIRGSVGPDADAAARLEVMGDTFLPVSTPTQIAARTLLDQRRLLQPQIRERIARNLAFLDQKLAGSAVSRLQAKGGWYATLRVPASLSDEEWALYLLETAGVHIHPGELFGFDREGFLVASLIAPEGEFREGTERLVEAIR